MFNNFPCVKAAMLAAVFALAMTQASAGQATAPASRDVLTIEVRAAEAITGDEAPNPPKIVADAMAFTPSEQNILSDLQDREGEINLDKMLPLVVARVERIGQISYDDYQNLEDPQVRLLRKYPSDFRFQPVRMNVTVVNVEKLLPGRNFPRSTYWPKDRPLWLMSAWANNTPDRESATLKIIATKDPASFLGKPEATDKPDVFRYAIPRRVELAGIFYKVDRGQTRGGQIVDSPVVIAWQFVGPQAETSTWAWTVPAGIVVAVILLFFFFLWRLAKIKQSRHQDRVQQMRRHMLPVEVDEDEAQQMDPELKAAAQQYLRDHPSERQQRPTVARQSPDQQDQQSQDDVDASLRAAAQEYRDRQGDDEKRKNGKR